MRFVIAALLVQLILVLGEDPSLPLWTFYRNSLFVAVTNVVVTLLTSSVLGYIFAKYTFRGREVLFWYVMAMMMVPPSVVMIPNYLILSDIGLLNNLWGLVVTAVLFTLRSPQQTSPVVSLRPIPQVCSEALFTLKVCRC